MDAQLADPDELSGVLNEALAVYTKVRNNGITETESMKQALTEFRQTTDPLAVWLEKHTVNDPEAIVPKNILNNEYNSRAAQEGRPFMTGNSFGRALKRLRPELQERQRTVIGKLTWVWLGIGLREDASR